MPVIHVRAKEGRVAFTASRGGKPIPADRWLATPDSPWLRRLADVHGDIEIRPPLAVAPTPEEAPAPEPVSEPAAVEEAPPPPSRRGRSAVA